MTSILIPIEGDMESDNLGVSDHVLREFLAKVNVIINCANCDDSESIQKIIRVNTLGALQLMNLSKQCRSFKVFLQLSSTYVSSWISPLSIIREKIYSQGDDPEDLLHFLLFFNKREVEKFRHSIKQKLNLSSSWVLSK